MNELGWFEYLLLGFLCVLCIALGWFFRVGYKKLPEYKDTP